MKINDTENYNKVRNTISMKNLSKIINSKNISITKLAQFSEITLTDSTINAYIAGDKLPSIPTLVSIANYLDCNIDYLLDRTDNPMEINKLNSLSKNEDLSILFNNISSLPADKQMLVDAYVKGLIDKQ